MFFYHLSVSHQMYKIKYKISNLPKALWTLDGTIIILDLKTKDNPNHA